MPTSRDLPTKNRILSAAEQLFAQFGYTGVSLRQITTTAKVNVAALNYHFYDKESLYRDLLAIHLRRINQHRIALLIEAEARAAGALVPLAEIVDALARPLFLPQPETGVSGVRLLGRILSERQPFTDTLLRTELHPATTRFGQAIRRHNPALPPDDFVWRLSFVIGALHHAVVTMPDMHLHTGGLCRSKDAEKALSNFSNFAAKALSA